ncbi:hypothetical protein Ae717Ps2_6101 [Pseudonocardia sp. Ae717_Ps2]|nr:hypothetical protein Ae717Ps2_6101 [Pseudonocardia sp. Ae717_Ps2]
MSGVDSVQARAIKCTVTIRPSGATIPNQPYAATPPMPVTVEAIPTAAAASSRSRGSVIQIHVPATATTSSNPTANGCAQPGTPTRAASANVDDDDSTSAHRIAAPTNTV